MANHSSVLEGFEICAEQPFNLLIDAGADVSAPDHFKNGALDVNAQPPFITGYRIGGNAQIIDDIVRSGADDDLLPIKAKSELIKEYLKACRDGSLNDIHALLIEDEVLFTYRDCRSGGVEAALYNPDRSVVKHLMEYGLNIYERQYHSYKNSNGNMVVHGFARFGDLALLESTLAAGDFVGKADFDGRTPLHFATAENRHAAVTVLIKHGANVNALDSDNMTPLHLAKNPLSIKALLSKGAYINAKCAQGNTPLIKSAQAHEVDACRFLIEAGADVHARNNTGETALHYSQDERVISLLLQAGAKIDAQNNNGWTPLHCHVHNSHLQAAQYLIGNGSDVNARSLDGGAPLHYASNVEIIVSLLQGGSDVNAKMEDGYTPLHCRALKGDRLACQELIHGGAKLNALGAMNDTPLLCASKNKHIDAVILLLDAGANPYIADNEDNNLGALAKDDADLRVCYDAFRAKKSVAKTCLTGLAPALH